MVQRYGVETIQRADVKDQGCDRQSEEDRDHQPGIFNALANKGDHEADGEASKDNS